MNPTLSRQLRRLSLAADRPPNSDEWEKFLGQLNSHYRHIDDDRNMLSRSLEITTEEMSRVQESVELERDHLRHTMEAVRAAVTEFAHACQHTRNSGGEDRSQITGARRKFNIAIAKLLSDFAGDNGESRELLNSLRTSFVELFEEVLSMVDPTMASTDEVVQMHRALIDQEFGAIADGVEVTVRCDQLHGIGGDMWNWTVMPNGEHFVCIGDATGHGTTAGFLSAMLAAAVRGTIEQIESIDLKELVDYLDRLVYSLGKQRMLMTFCAVVIEPTKRSAAVINAGHAFPIILREGNAKSLMAKGNPLGTLGADSMRVGHITLHAGDQIVLTTDGIAEVRNPMGVEYGERRVRRQIESVHQLVPTQIIDHVWSDIDGYRESEPIEDDRTMVVISIPD